MFSKKSKGPSITKLKKENEKLSQDIQELEKLIEKTKLMQSQDSPWLKRKSRNIFKSPKDSRVSSCSGSMEFIPKMEKKSLSESVLTLHNSLTITKCSNSRPSTSHSPSRNISKQHVKSRSSSASGTRVKSRVNSSQQLSISQPETFFKKPCWTNQNTSFKFKNNELLPNRFSFTLLNSSVSSDKANSISKTFEKMGNGVKLNKNISSPKRHKSIAQNDKVFTTSGHSPSKSNKIKSNGEQNLLIKGNNKASINSPVYPLNSKKLGVIKSTKENKKLADNAKYCTPNNLMKYPDSNNQESVQTINKLPLINQECKIKNDPKIIVHDSQPKTINSTWGYDLLPEYSDDEPFILETKSICGDNLNREVSLNIPDVQAQHVDCEHEENAEQPHIS